MNRLYTALLAAALVIVLGWARPECLYASVESLSHTGKLPPTKKTSLRWGRDPFVPLIKGTEAIPLLKLKAILFRGERPSAIINDKILYKGSVVEDQKVIAIGKSHVILQGRSGTIRLELDAVSELSDEINKRR